MPGPLAALQMTIDDDDRQKTLASKTILAHPADR